MSDLDSTIALDGACGNTVGRTRTRARRARRERAPVDLSRWCDVFIAMAALVFFAPLMGVIYLLVRAEGAPAVFRQVRIGRGGAPFECLKFRSMVPDAEARLQRVLASCEASRQEWQDTQKLKRDPRITPTGKFLRLSSLDELPQLFNVLRGEMSIVGPRPIVAGEVVKYGRWFSHYCHVRPGITGMWQVSGRNDTSYRQRVALDVFYKRHRSFRLYTFIIAKTVPAVLFRKGSY